MFFKFVFEYCVTHVYGEVTGVGINGNDDYFNDFAVKSSDGDCYQRN